MQFHKYMSLLLLALALALFLGPVCAENDEPVVIKLRVVKIDERLTSPILTLPEIKNEEINLPGRDGKGFPIKFEQSRVLVDREQNGKMDFTAWSSGKSSPFDLTLFYPGDERVKQRYKIVVKTGLPHLMRMSAVAVSTPTFDDMKIADDNNNGYFGEVFMDAVYRSKSNFGCPLSPVMLGSDGFLYDVSINRPGTKMTFSRNFCETGELNMLTGWGGTSPPDSILIRGAGRSGAQCFDVAHQGEVSIPLGAYNVFAVYMKDVFIDAEGSGISVVIAPEGICAPEWCKTRKILVEYRYVDVTNEMSFKPPITIIGENGERYFGEFFNSKNFKAVARCRAADGSFVGGSFAWQMKDINIDPSNTERMFTNLDVKVPEGAVDILMTCEIPGVGTAEAVFPIKK